MTTIEDIVIIGAGPAGVSAAWALAEEGIRPRLLDAGRGAVQLPPDRDYLEARHADDDQARWMLGSPSVATTGGNGTSPKLRVPGFRSVFDGYAEANGIRGDDGFHVVGALAAGGLSNAWGCGVATFELTSLGPLSVEAMRDAYERVAQRMGLSGSSDDPLRERLGLDEWSEPAIDLDDLHAGLWARRRAIDGSPVALGRARVAVIGTDRESRGGCVRRGLCLWGCPRHSTWNAVHDLNALLGRHGLRFDAGWRVDRLIRHDGLWRIEASTPQGGATIVAHRILVAAGTLASTKLVLGAVEGIPPEVRLQSNPMAAFLAVVPRTFGRAPQKAFGLAQLSYEVAAGSTPVAFGNLFSTAGLPVTEFLGHLPTTHAAGLPLLRTLLPSCTVGNVFFDGGLSAHRARVDRDGRLHIAPAEHAELEATRTQVRRNLAGALRRLGAWMLPGSFVAGRPGADLHYAATLPISAYPAAHECHLDGQVASLPGLHVVDAASLPHLPARPHTLTVMANADRIARDLAAAITSQ